MMQTTDARTSKTTKVRLELDESPLNSLFYDKGFELPDGRSNGLVVLIRGKPGLGKTTLAMQILTMLKAPRTGKPKAFIISVEQSAAELQLKLARMLAHRVHNAASFINYGKDGNCYLDCDVEVLRKQLNELCPQITLPHPLEPFAKVLGQLFGQDDSTTIQADSRNKQADSAKTPIDKELDKLQPLVDLIFPKMDSLVTAHSTMEDGQEAPSKKEAHKEAYIVDSYRKRENSLSLLLDLLRDKNILNFGTRDERPVVMLDGLSTLSSDDQREVEVQELVTRLRRGAQLSLIAFEPLTDQIDPLSHQVDMVIELHDRFIKDSVDYLVHELWIRKSRCQFTGLGRHQFKFTDAGLEIFPSIHFQAFRSNWVPNEFKRSHKLAPAQPRQEPAAPGTELPPNTTWSVIDMMLGGVGPGESVSLFGPRGTFKRNLCEDFLLRGKWARCMNDPPPQASQKASSGIDRIQKAAESPSTTNGDAEDKPQHGLLVSLLDNAETIHKRFRCSLFDPDSKACAKCKVDPETGPEHIFAYYQRPGCITPAELMFYIKKRIKEEKMTRLAFWDLTQIDHRFPLLLQDRLFLPVLLDVFDGAKVASIMMGSENASYTQAVSAISDNVIFCWRSTLDKTKIKHRKETPRAFYERLFKRASQGQWKPGQEKGEHLILYVDRKATSHSHKEEKSLYAIPIEGDEIGLPRTMGDLQNRKVNREDWQYFTKTVEEVEKITQLQGLK